MFRNHRGFNFALAVLIGVSGMRVAVASVEECLEFRIAYTNDTFDEHNRYFSFVLIQKDGTEVRVPARVIVSKDGAVDSTKPLEVEFVNPDKTIVSRVLTEAELRSARLSTSASFTFLELNKSKTASQTGKRSRASEPHLGRAFGADVLHAGAEPEAHARLVAEAGLVPKHNVSIGSANISMSDAFEASTGQVVVLAISE